jgi:hypothetical protein
VYCLQIYININKSTENCALNWSYSGFYKGMSVCVCVGHRDYVAVGFTSTCVPIQSVYITTRVVSPYPAHGEE